SQASWCMPAIPAAQEAETGGLQVQSQPQKKQSTKQLSVRPCYDLYSAYDYIIPPMEKALVKTDVQIALPSGCYGRVAPRPGLAAKHFIDVRAGVIDKNYRGNVGVVLFNFGKEKFEKVMPYNFQYHKIGTPALGTSCAKMQVKTAQLLW
uniref:Deoxyuridine 5'-triphosphate nucleotidohydrolase n=1 Tax=Urocitellus parryii TaxID=9999 RepID=A0A8D2HD95_UROPR